jgi:hypothetical protein
MTVSLSSILAAACEFSGILIGSSIQPGQEPGRLGGQNAFGGPGAPDVQSRARYEGNPWAAADDRDGVDTSMIDLFYSSFNPCYDERESAADGLSLPHGVELAEDGLAPARGILLAITLCAPVWVIMTLGVYLLLH